MRFLEKKSKTKGEKSRADNLAIFLGKILAKKMAKLSAQPWPSYQLNFFDQKS